MPLDDILRQVASPDPLLAAPAADAYLDLTIESGTEPRAPPRPGTEQQQQPPAAQQSRPPEEPSMTDEERWPWIGRSQLYQLRAEGRSEDNIDLINRTSAPTFDPTASSSSSRPTPTGPPTTLRPGAAPSTTLDAEMTPAAVDDFVGSLFPEEPIIQEAPEEPHDYIPEEPRDYIPEETRDDISEEQFDLVTDPVADLPEHDRVEMRKRYRPLDDVPLGARLPKNVRFNPEPPPPPRGEVRTLDPSPATPRPKWAKSEAQNAALDDVPVSIRAQLNPQRGVPDHSVLEISANMHEDIQVLLVGRARSKEIKMKDLNIKQREAVRKAMGDEWQKWVNFTATQALSEDEFARLQREHPANARPVDTRWVLTEKSPGVYKARLVVIGCQEARLSLRSDSPTGSTLGFNLVLMCSAQHGWGLRSYDAQSAYLQAGGISRLLLLRLPGVDPPPGTLPNQIVKACGSIYGTRDAGRGWYLFLKEHFKKYGWRELRLEKAVYVWLDRDGKLRAIAHSHVDDLLTAYDKNCKEVLDILDNLQRELHMKMKQNDFLYCGKWVTANDQHVMATQADAADALEDIELPAEWIRDKTMMLPAEYQTAYRSAVGMLLWLAGQTRADLSFATSKAARRSGRATIEDALEVNHIIAQARTYRTSGLVFWRGTGGLGPDVSILAWADASFANVEGVRSQCGHITSLTSSPRLYSEGRFDTGCVILWQSATVKRVVRSTLAAEAYGISEGVETAQWVRHVMAEILNPDASLTDIETHAVKRIIHAVTDSQNLADNVDNDAGASADKRLRIVVAMLREAFSLAENAYLTWIPTWRMLADALTKLVCGSMLRAALSGQRFTATPPVKRDPASAKMPTRAPPVLAGQVVKTLLASSLARTASASSDTMEAFHYINDIYFIVKVPFRVFSVLVFFTLVMVFLTLVAALFFGLYTQTMGKTTTSTPTSARSAVASSSSATTTPPSTRTRVDTPRMSVTEAPGGPEPPPAIPIGTEVPPPPPRTALEAATTAAARSRRSLERVRALQELRRLQTIHR